MSPMRTCTVTNWLDDDEMLAWRRLIEVYTDVHASLDADLQREHGLSEGDYGVLVALSEAEGDALRMCEVARQLHLSPSGLTRRLDSMVRRGLVDRVPSPDDRRVTLAVLTPSGRATLEAAAPDHVASVRRHLLDHLTRDQIREIGVALDTVKRTRGELPGAARVVDGFRPDPAPVGVPT